MWISLELEPFLSLQASGWVAVPPPDAAGADAAGGVEHAENAITAAAASAPTLASFIQSPPLDRPAIRTTPVEPSWPLPEHGVDSTAHPPGCAGGGLRNRRPAAVTTRSAVPGGAARIDPGSGGAQDA